MSSNSIQKLNQLWPKIDHQTGPCPKHKFRSTFNVWIESIIPTIGPGVLKYDESNGEGLNPELESQKPKFSDWGTLKGGGVAWKIFELNV